MNSPHDGLPWHAQDLQAVLTNLDTDSLQGLSLEEAQQRLKAQGPNVLPSGPKKKMWFVFLNQFLNPLVFLLGMAAAVAFFVGEGYDAIVILVVVLLNACVGFFQEGRAEASLATLKKLSVPYARVVRDGQEMKMDATQIVPGDLILLSAGEGVPADARLIEASAFKTSEAVLTGESVPVEKRSCDVPLEVPLSDRLNQVYAGTYVVSGRARAIVFATGSHQEIAKIVNLTKEVTSPPSSLELKVKQFGKMLTILAPLLFLLMLGVGWYRGFSFSQVLMLSLSQMVSLIPEGLPVAMTIALAVGVQRMAKRKAIVRKLGAVETVGSATVICTDKTGTLTENKMMVTQAYLPSQQKIITLTGEGYAPQGKWIGVDNPLGDAELILLLEACVLCNDAKLIPPQGANSFWDILGDPTEAALLTFAAKAGLDLDLLRQQFPRINEIPFNSEFKMMASQHHRNGKSVLFLKGALEAILNLCDLSDDRNKKNQKWDELKKQNQKVAEKFAQDSLRVLAFASIEADFFDLEKGFEKIRGKIIFLGIVGQQDLPRKGVRESVQECLKAGIRPVMVTGDHVLTAVAIAESVNILDLGKGHLVLDGQQLEALSDEKILDQLDDIRVFARVHPAQKLRIIDLYQRKKERVIMTGDGVNDAPALMKAHVGVAMGISGTDLAKEAAKIVLTDDHFSTLVTAIGEGRLVYQNIKKLILFLFVTSLDEVIILLGALLLGYPAPLAAVQILWINLVTEGVLTINLVMDPLEGSEMKRPPVSMEEPLLDAHLLRRIPLMLFSSVGVVFTWFTTSLVQGKAFDLIQSEVFTLLVMCQWFNVLNCRSAEKSIFSKHFFKNPGLLLGLVFSVFLHLLVIYWSPLGSFFHTVPIPFYDFLMLVGLASFVLWVEETRKAWVRNTVDA